MTNLDQLFLLFDTLELKKVNDRFENIKGFHFYNSFYKVSPQYVFINPRNTIF